MEIVQVFGAVVAVTLGVALICAAFGPLIRDDDAAGVKVSRG